MSVSVRVPPSPCLRFFVMRHNALVTDDIGDYSSSVYRSRIGAATSATALIAAIRRSRVTRVFLYTSLFTKQVAQNNKTHKYSNLKNNDNLTKRT